MSTVILLKSNEITKSTILGGNIDIDRYLPAIKACQQTKIKGVLGKELYDKIQLLFETSSLTGLYLEMYEDYIKEMVIHGSAEIYLSQGAYLVSNNGITKTKTDSSETVSKEEVDYLVQASRKLFDEYKREFLEWIKINGASIPEWPVNSRPATTRINVGGWSLTKRKYNKCNCYNNNCNCNNNCY